MKHTGIAGERPCYFSTREDVRDEWNTSIRTADDYYKWKLSPAALEKIKKEERKKMIRALGGM